MTIPDVLICPKCASPLIIKDKSLVCSGAAPHCYDISASGDVNLLPPGKMNNAKAGDGREMLRARVSFLSGGYYDAISNAVSDCIIKHSPRDNLTILDAGCGEGYHLCSISKNLQSAEKNVTAIGLDASKFGADMGAKAARKSNAPAFFATANIFEMPVAANCCDAIISMFAPIPPIETSRILADDGVLVVCASGPRHLWEMRCLLYGEPIENNKGITTPEGFHLIEQNTLSYTVELPDNETINNLFTMTPFYHRCPKAEKKLLLPVHCLLPSKQSLLFIKKMFKDYI